MFRAPGAAQLAAPYASEAGYRSPGLQLIFDRIKAGQKTSILDLGPPLAANVGFLSSYRCRLYIGDCLQSLPVHDEPWGRAPAFSPLFAEVLALTANDQFDVIFCWDLINYLSNESIRRFSRFLAQHSNADALCFFSLVTQKTMPSQPGKYRIIAEDVLHCEQDCDEACPSPRFTQRRILESMPEFQSHRSFLLQNGHQEQILRAR